MSNVANEEMLSSIPTEPGAASKRGVEYEIADGTRMPNEGEKKFEAMTGEGQHKKLVVQVCGVNQGHTTGSCLTRTGATS